LITLGLKMDTTVFLVEESAQQPLAVWDESQSVRRRPPRRYVPEQGHSSEQGQRSNVPFVCAFF
jgi:hypothetical protein